MVRRNLTDYETGDVFDAAPDDADRPAGVDPPLVSILVPARNEARNIEACLSGLLRQAYPAWELWVLDDGSTDDTAARVRRLTAGCDRVRLISGGALPPGWAGKAYACAQLAQHARGEWLMFVDADTRSGPGLLECLARAARATDADLISTFPRQEIGSPGEALLVPFIFWFLFTMLPIQQVWAHPAPAFAAACGQLLFIRRAAYGRSGGHAAIPASLHDGLHLARLFKRHRLRVRLVDLSARVSCRMYRGLRECWHGFSRNSFQAIGSFAVLLGVTAVEASLFLGPFLSLAGSLRATHSLETVLALTQVGILLGIQVSLQRRFRYPWATVLLHPAGIAAWIALSWRSWWLTQRQAPVDWKGREVRARITTSPERRHPPRR